MDIIVGICVWPSGTGSYVSPSTSGFPYQYNKLQLRKNNSRPPRQQPCAHINMNMHKYIQALYNTEINKLLLHTYKI